MAQSISVQLSLFPDASVGPQVVVLDGWLKTPTVEVWLKNPDTYPMEFRRKGIFVRLHTHHLVCGGIKVQAHLYWSSGLVMVRWLPVPSSSVEVAKSEGAA